MLKNVEVNSLLLMIGTFLSDLPKGNDDSMKEINDSVARFIS
jgi:hypothetical protein